MKILALESSCDETAAAVVELGPTGPVILSNIVASQIDIHAKYGGVVPEVAARAHIENVVPVIKEALDTADVKLTGIDRIAVTNGPGLIGSLVVGVETAKAMSLATSIPLFPINHLEGHIYASFIPQQGDWSAPKFPLIALLVSGGNSLLIHMRGHFDYQIIGQTRDDAAGEAFDKGAKLLGLSYPGGPIISKLAAEGAPDRFLFPVIDLTDAPARNSEGFMERPELSLDFSFSGLKTSLLTKVKATPILTTEDKKDLSAGYEQAIVATLVQNSLRGLKKYPAISFILAGGVAANKVLREELKSKISENYPDIKFYQPDLSYCGDNAAMIGAVAAYKPKGAQNDDFVAVPNLKL